MNDIEKQENELLKSFEAEYKFENFTIRHFGIRDDGLTVSRMSYPEWYNKPKFVAVLYVHTFIELLPPCYYTIRDCELRFVNNDKLCEEVEIESWTMSAKWHNIDYSKYINYKFVVIKKDNLEARFPWVIGTPWETGENFKSLFDNYLINAFACTSQESLDQILDKYKKDKNLIHIDTSNENEPQVYDRSDKIYKIK